jgi:hypothetical protein
MKKPGVAKDFEVVDFMDTSTDTSARHHTDLKVSLLDIARPAKQKGKKNIIIIFIISKMTH